MKHTPWEYHAKLTASENHRGYSITGGSARIADVMPIDEDGVKGKEYARRIVACVNACAGIPTGNLEAGGVLDTVLRERDQLEADNATLRAALQAHGEEAAKLIAQRDELLAALKDMVDDFGPASSDAFRSLGPARAAITNATDHIANPGKMVGEEAAKLMEANRELLDALKDMLGGWVYIRQSHGDLYGVGWDRAENAARAAINKHTTQERK